MSDCNKCFDKCLECKRRQEAYQQGREDERAKVIDEILFRISKITTYYAGDKDGKAITPVMFIRDEVVKTVEQLKG